jgi:hypothetical protein
MLAYSKKYYQRHRKQIVSNQREYQKERYDRLRTEILEMRRSERDKTRKIPFTPSQTS